MYRIVFFTHVFEDGVRRRVAFRHARVPLIFACIFISFIAFGPGMSSASVPFEPLANGEIADNTSSERQRRFGAERDILKKESVPEKVWQQIVQGEDNESIRQQIAADDRPEAWVEASLIDISKNDVPALLVVGRASPLANFNKANIWIFTRDGNDYKRVLSVRVFELEILDEEVNGYRSIKLFNVTASDVFEELFRFDGRRYRRNNAD
jgi:hypothetical protein